MRNNIVNVANDPQSFDPVYYLDPKIVEYDGRTLIHIRVPASAEMHAYKGVVYDRNGDADVRVRSVAAKGLMLMRKQRIFTERHVYPYVTKADLNLAELPRMRTRAQNNVRDGQRHPWMDMNDDQLQQKALKLPRKMRKLPRKMRKLPRNGNKLPRKAHKLPRNGNKLPRNLRGRGVRMPLNMRLPYTM